MRDMLSLILCVLVCTACGLKPGRGNQRSTKGAGTNTEDGTKAETPTGHGNGDSTAQDPKDPKNDKPAEGGPGNGQGPKPASARTLKEAVPASQTGKFYFVSPTGSSSASGDVTAPWDLTSALGSKPVAPGDTIWVRGGVYTGNFVSALKGSPDKPVIIRSYPGERAVLAASGGGPILQVNGSYSWFWGLELAGTQTNRVSSASGSNGDPGMPAGVRLGSGQLDSGVANKLINNEIHDASGAIYDLWGASHTEVTGNILYFTGWDAPDRGHGHDVYVQNLGRADEVNAIRTVHNAADTATITSMRTKYPNSVKTYIQNISFDAYNMGLHGYTEKGWVDDIQWIRNVAFNAGILSTHSQTCNIFQSSSMRPVLDGNMTWGGSNNVVGGGSKDGKILNNYFADTAANQLACAACVSSGNSVFPSASRPAENKIFILTDPYEAGRATIVVYNWKHLDEVEVTLPSDLAMAAGDKFEIRDVQNLHKGAAAQSDMGQPLIADLTWAPATKVKLPMKGLVAATPAGLSAPPTHSAPEFGVFLVRPVWTPK